MKRSSKTPAAGHRRTPRQSAGIAWASSPSQALWGKVQGKNNCSQVSGTCPEARRLWAMTAMISAMNSTCCCLCLLSKYRKRSRCFGIEADAETEGEAEAEASAGRVHGGNHCSPRRDEGSEASTSWKVVAITFVVNSTCCCFCLEKQRQKLKHKSREQEKQQQEEEQMQKHRHACIAEAAGEGEAHKMQRIITNTMEKFTLLHICSWSWESGSLAKMSKKVP